ncbi:MAG: aldo/keto reductase [Nocardioides sp.]|uniref:aldo/keto reductase n=1 Tax=Nocardioides sp. TaxID=35761 RepID=UPI0039E51AA0
MTETEHPMNPDRTIPVPSLPLRDGGRIPQLGFGVFQIPPEDTERVVREALSAGYRHIDTAQGYRNEREVIAAIEASGIDPDEVFVTSKLSNAHLTYEEARAAIDGTIRDFGDKVPDLFLIHWPLPTVRDFTIVWRAIEEAYQAGTLRAIGVSNFHIPHLERLMEVAEVQPEVNQIELHPYLTQEPLRAFHAEHGILTEAWSPIGQGLVLADPVIGAIARRVGRTPAQVILRWHLQRDTIVFPRSTNPGRIRENFDLFDFALEAADMAAITALNRDQRTGGDPDTFRYKY